MGNWWLFPIRELLKYDIQICRFWCILISPKSLWWLIVLRGYPITSHWLCANPTGGPGGKWGFNVSKLPWSCQGMNCKTRSPAVARMADRTAPVVKLTLTLTQILPGVREWDGVSANATAAKLAKTGTSPLTTSQLWKIISSLKIS